MAKLPLENAAQERAVLGSLISNTNTFWAVKDRVRPEIFTAPVNRRIAEIMHKAVEAGRELTIPTIVSRMTVDPGSDFSPEGYLAMLIADEADPASLHDFLGDLEEMAVRRKMMAFGQDLIRQATEDNGQDALTRLELAKEKVDQMGDPLSTSVRHVSAIASTLLTNLNEAVMEERTVGLNVGLKGFQDLAGALMPGRVYLLAGPPGSGKTALAFQIAAHVATTPVREGEDPPAVLFEEIEMEGEELVERDLAARTGITADRIERASVNDAELENLYAAAEALNSSRLYIDSATNPTISQIRAKAMRMKRMRGLGLVVIDHLLYIGRDRKLGEFEGIRANMQGVKKLARDLQVPILLLAQLKKEYGDGPWQQIRRPSVNDLYGGSAPEQESDVVLFVHREEYLLKRKEPAKDAKDRPDWESQLMKVEGTGELVIAKRRGGNAHGVRRLYFDGKATRFYDNKPNHLRTLIDEPVPGFDLVP